MLIFPFLMYMLLSFVVMRACIYEYNDFLCKYNPVLRFFAFIVMLFIAPIIFIGGLILGLFKEEEK